MKIKSGNNEILYSGTVIAIKKENIVFEFPEMHNSYKFIFEFVKDSNIPDSPIQFDLKDSKTLEIKLINIDKSIASGNSDILDLGSLNGKKLYLNYRILVINELSHSLSYTFYLGEEVKNG